MFLLTKDNISGQLLAELVGMTVLFASKFGIKIIRIDPIIVDKRYSRGTNRNGYLFRRVQEPHLLRSDSNSHILHGITEDIIRFIKTDDYDLDGSDT